MIFTLAARRTSFSLSGSVVAIAALRSAYGPFDSLAVVAALHDVQRLTIQVDARAAGHGISLPCRENKSSLTPFIQNSGAFGSESGTRETYIEHSAFTH